jgi:D-3-phosphoglycerate dehydrogenase / 2-oxoglutarate reductase
MGTRRVCSDGDHLTHGGAMAGLRAGREIGMKVLVSDALSDVGVRIFEETPGIDVTVKTDLGPEGILKEIGGYDALVIRSATKVTREVIEAGANLKVIGRAGIGLDNVDIEAASRRGIVVMNTPDGNTITTAEHAIALLMSLTRNIPRATASMKAGKWEKKLLKGREVYGKTLGLVGLGHIGRIVADRAQGLKMKVIVYDPYLKPSVIEAADCEPVGFEELLSRSDYVTVHVPKTGETAGLLGAEAFAGMKRGAMLINCARGGIVDEDALCEALSSGHLAGAALDVFASEPPGKHRLMDLDNFVCTPHLGASTMEAQDNVAKDVAEQIVAYLLHGTVKNAVNVPSVSAELMSVLRPWVVLGEKLGMLQGQLASSGVEEVEVRYLGKVTEYDVRPLTTGVLKGLLTPVMKDDVNYINARMVASDRGIKVLESTSEKSEDFGSLIMVRVKTVDGENVVSGTIFGKTLPRILRINDFYLEAVPEGHMLLIHNEDKPGVIGRICSTLGERSINISRMHVGQDPRRARNIIILSTEIPAGEEALQEIRGLENVHSAFRIEL